MIFQLSPEGQERASHKNVKKAPSSQNSRGRGQGRNESGVFWGMVGKRESKACGAAGVGVVRQGEESSFTAGQEKPLGFKARNQFLKDHMGGQAEKGSE